MKRFALISLLIIAAVCGLIYADTRTENGLIEELGIILTPDPMKIIHMTRENVRITCLTK
jgi:hypothetical protein